MGTLNEELDKRKLQSSDAKQFHISMEENFTPSQLQNVYFAQEKKAF